MLLNITPFHKTQNATVLFLPLLYWARRPWCTIHKILVRAQGRCDEETARVVEVTVMTLHWRLALLTAACATAFGGTWVVPNMNTAGNQAATIGTKAKRLQQTVGGGQFPGAMVITGIRLRAQVL